MVVDDELLSLAKGTDTINANAKKVVHHQSVNLKHTVSVNINNTSSHKQHTIKNHDKKERQSIFNEMMTNASKSNKRITRQKTKLVTNECLYFTDREIRAICCSHGSTTTSSNCDKSNTNNDCTSAQATTTVDKTIHKVTDAVKL